MAAVMVVVILIDDNVKRNKSIKNKWWIQK